MEKLCFNIHNKFQQANKSINKEKLSLCLTIIKHYTMKAYVEVDVEIHIFLTLALAESEWSASHPSHFTLGNLNRPLLERMMMKTID
jgi:hypothetical protein